MAQPVSNVDIEDVLASIRRLVVAPAAEAATAGKLPASGRLMLTSDQRVPDGIGGVVEAGPPRAEVGPSSPYLLVRPVAVPLGARPADPGLGPPEDVEEVDPAGSGRLDQDRLRALLAEVVRSELEGPLGARITENVRKIVRREIVAMLAGRADG